MAVGDAALTIEKLRREHGERIRAYLARLVGSAEAEDLEQDVYEKAQRAIGTFRGDSRVLTWLYRVATNVAIDRLRSAGRRAELERDDAEADTLGGVATAGAPSERSLDGEVDRSRAGPVRRAAHQRSHARVDVPSYTDGSAARSPPGRGLVAGTSRSCIRSSCA